jgi:alkylation response protein AidB-like acyl-CoA dehydrogenase
VDFELSPSEQAFRDEVRSWLAGNLPAWAGGEDGDVSPEQWLEQRRAWQRTLHAAGYVGIGWPKEYGGRGATLIEQLVFNEEMIRARAPEPINIIGLGMGGPVIIAHGTPEQQARYLPPLLSADEIWCQGFSEPNAGSDLSALQTRAEGRGDHYLVNGQKVWTTLAHVARWCLLLTREQPAANPRDGLTYLIVDMQSPGVEVRPLRQITGEAEFNEIFFHDVEVPKTQLLGEPLQGWRVAMTTLLHERGTLGVALAAQSGIVASDLVDHARTAGQGGDRLARQRVAQHWIEARCLRLNSYRAVTNTLRTGIPGPEGSILKLMWSELNQRMAESGVDLLGMAGRTGGAGRPGGRGALPHKEWLHSFLRSRGNTIEAGTSEVLRNILAERVLSLPRSR